MSDKSMMFELWTECGSNCKFCYLGAKNQHTPDSEKLHNISKVSNIIKDKCLFIISVKSFISKITNTGKLDVSEINNTVGKLLEDAIHEDELLNLGELTRGNSLELLSDSILSKLRAMKDKNIK